MISRLAWAYTRFRPGHRAEVAEQPRLDVLGQQRLAQQRVGHQVDLADRQVVRRAPPGVEPAQRVGVERARRVGQRRTRWAARVSPAPLVSWSAAVSPPMLASCVMAPVYP